MKNHSDAPKKTFAQRYAHTAEQFREQLAQISEVTEQQWRDIVEQASEKTHQWASITRDEAKILSGYVARDLRSASDYLNKTGRSLIDWLEFDLQLIEKQLGETYSQAIDQTRITLAQMSETPRPSYRAGEHTGPGTLICTACGFKIVFHQPAEIPACAHCHAKLFERPGSP